MKLELLIIPYQHVVENMYSDLVHTIRHSMGIGFAQTSKQRSPITLMFHIVIECGLLE